MRKLLLILSFLVLPFSAALAYGPSSINPQVPANQSSLTSSVVRTNFLAAYNDVTNIYSILNSMTPFPGVPLEPNYGGTGQTSLTQNALIVGNGIFGVNFLSPGTSGNCLISNGSQWVPTTCLGTLNFSAGTTGLTPSSPTTGAIVLGGTLKPSNGGTGCSGGSLLSSGSSSTWNGTDCYVSWNSSTTSNKAESIAGCTSSYAWRKLQIKDEIGTSNLYPIIITPSSGTCEGQSICVVGTYKQSRTLVCDGVSNWMVM